MESPPFSYNKFVEFAFDQAKLRIKLTPHPSQESFRFLQAKDGKTVLHGLSFQAPKIRLIRSMTIDGGQDMQVLDLAAFPDQKDLNPMYNVIIDQHYKGKYYKKLLPLGCKYAEVLPWGEKLTSESMRFFSPIVIWSKFTPTIDKHNILYSAFMEYFKAWLELVDLAVEESDSAKVLCNREAQHRYLTWRVEKDPGYPLLRKLIGEDRATEVVRRFLFEGVESLGAKKFLDYFPEYLCDDGTVNRKRSVIGKAYETRPWDSRGEFIGEEPR